MLLTKKLAKQLF